MKLSDYIAATIAAQGARHVFLLPGGGCMHLVDSVGKEPGLEFVACLHEQTAAVAADAYAQYTRNLGVALVTTGPGSTNALTGVAGSWVESAPVLILSGQVKTADIKPSPGMRMLGFQEVDTAELARPVTKYAVTVRDPQTIRYHLEKALYLARHGRPGPVWLDVPLDVQAARIDPETLAAFSPDELSTAAPDGAAALREAVARTLDALSGAERPVLIAGCGIKLARGEERFRRVAERLGIPVLTTWKGCDLLPDDHPDYFGRPGVLAQRGANFIQQNADFLLAVGARLDFGQIGYASDAFARGARKVIVDIDPFELEKFRFPVEEKICADAGAFLAELERQTTSFARSGWAPWKARCLAWKQGYPLISPGQRAQTDYVNTYVLVEALSKLMGADDLLVPGSSGACSDVCLQSFRLKPGQRVLNSPGIGSMGFGLPQTIGACLASGGRRTVCVNGDGGFQLNVQDLETVRRLGLPIKYFILNNQGYASMRATHRNYFEGRLVASNAASGLTLPDVKRQAAAYGIAHNRIENHAELEARVLAALSSDGPFISEVMIDPEELTAPKVKSVIGPDGRMVSRPLEDLAPFLDREEFLSNMLVPPMPGYEILPT